VYHYINHQMTNHAISIDGLIQASDALGKMIKRKDVEERRAKAVSHELELMRQREEMRQERARKRASKASVEVEPPVEADVEVEADKKSLSASLDAELSTRTSPMQMRAEADEGDEEALDLMERTPMPMEEECMWR
jgi:hypothetical protein